MVINLHWIGGHEVRFVRHGEVLMNVRSSPFTRKRWLLLLGYLLDFKDLQIFREVYSVFGQLMFWNMEDRSLAHVLVNVLIDDPLDVPHSLVIKHGKEINGARRSWTVPVYMFNLEPTDVVPANEEDPPEHSGNPHPFEGPVVPREDNNIM